ncbi:MAG: hypothetical protein Q9163_005148 [Psora crenata]
MGCLVAIEGLLDDFSDIPPDQEIEFFDEIDGPPATLVEPIYYETPLKFAARECSVVVVMLGRFTAAQLPGSSGSPPRRPTDVATSADVEDAVYRVYSECDKLPGWLSIGTLLLPELPV